MSQIEYQGLRQLDPQCAPDDVDAQIVEAQQAVRNLEQRKAELLALPAPEAV